MELTCKNCRASITAENINIHEMVAVCHRCNHVFDFSEDVLTRKAKQRKVKQPENLRIRDNGDWVELSYSRVLSKEDTVGLMVSVLILGVVVFSFLAASSDDAPAMVLAILGSIGTGAAYTLVVFLGNTTRLIIDNKSLMVRFTPLPFPGYDEKTLPHDQILSVFCEETADSRESGSLQHYYHIWVELADNSRAILLKGLPQDYAFYIAQALKIICGVTLIHLRSSLMTK